MLRLRATSPRTRELLDLAAGEVDEALVVAGGELAGGAVPFDGLADGLLEGPARGPVEEAEGFVGGEVELVGLVRRVGVGAVRPLAGPGPEDAAHEFGDGAVGFEGGAEVEGGVDDFVGGEELRGEGEVAAEGLEDVLPGAGGGGVAHGDGLAGLEGAHGIGDDAVFGPVAAADDIAGAGAGDADAVAFEERFAPGGDGEFGAGLARAVGIVAAERVFLAIAVVPLAVFVALVRGDEDGGAGLGEFAQGLEHVDGAEHIGLPGLDRQAVGAAHEWLRGEVKDEIGVRLTDRVADGHWIADVAENVADARLERELLEKRGGGVRRKREAVDVGAQGQEPFGEPASLEARDAGDPDVLVREDLGFDYHIFHGAPLLAPQTV